MGVPVTYVVKVLREHHLDLAAFCSPVRLKVDPATTIRDARTSRPRNADVRGTDFREKLAPCLWSSGCTLPVLFKMEEDIRGQHNHLTGRTDGVANVASQARQP